MNRTGFDEVDEAGPTVELCQEESGVGLRLGRFDPVEARPESAVVDAAFSENSAAVAAHSHHKIGLSREREREWMMR